MIVTYSKYLHKKYFTIGIRQTVHFIIPIGHRCAFIGVINCRFLPTQIFSCKNINLTTTHLKKSIHNTHVDRELYAEIVKTQIVVNSNTILQTYSYVHGSNAEFFYSLIVDIYNRTIRFIPVCSGPLLYLGSLLTRHWTQFTFEY